MGEGCKVVMSVWKGEERKGFDPGTLAYSRVLTLKPRRCNCIITWSASAKQAIRKSNKRSIGRIPISGSDKRCYSARSSADESSPTRRRSPARGTTWRNVTNQEVLAQRADLEEQDSGVNNVLTRYAFEGQYART